MRARLPAALLAAALLAGAGQAAGRTAEGPAEAAFAAAVAAVRDHDYREAVDLFEALAVAADHDAQYNLALLLRRGLGRPQNFPAALEWAVQAQLGGVRRAPPLVAELRAALPPAEVAAVMARVRAALEVRLQAGDAAAIAQFVDFCLDHLEEPDTQAALIWALVGAALDLPGAAARRDGIAGMVGMDDLLEAQAAAADMFTADRLWARFSQSGAPVR